MRMYFDTETTNFYFFEKGWDHPDQPACAQVAAVLETDSGKTVAAVSALIAQRWPARETQPTIDPLYTWVWSVGDELRHRHFSGEGPAPSQELVAARVSRTWHQPDDTSSIGVPTRGDAAHAGRTRISRRPQQRCGISGG